MPDSLRIITFNVMPRAYDLVATWARQSGHQLVLLVTTPSPEGDRYEAGHRELVSMLSPEQDVLVTKRLRRTARPVIAALEPDLIVAATFPHRIPSVITEIPRYGALNLHPAPLPRGRGPNPTRLIYEGDQFAAATVHRIAPEFDAGPILGQRQRPLPEHLEPQTIFTMWRDMLIEALDEAVTRAVAGDPGDAQDDARATYAAPFTEEERWLRWDEPGQTIQRRVAALNVMAPFALACLNGREALVHSVRAERMAEPLANPGTVLRENDGRATVSVADGVVEVVTRPD